MENVDQTTPTPTQSVQPRKGMLAAVITGALVIIALGYFLGVPALQINSYKKDAEAKHRQANDKMLRVYDSFKRGAFTNADSKPETDKLDVQVAKDAVKDAESTLNANAPAMTKFSAWPLLAWKKSYKQATNTDAAEESYIKQARAFLGEYKVLLDYTDKTDDIGIKMDAALKDLEKLGDQSGPAAMADMIDADVAKVKPLIDDYKAVTPPTYLKENTDSGTRTIGQIIATLQDLSSGARTLDLAKITKASTDIQSEQTSIEAIAKNFVDILQNKSPIQSQISKLRSQDAEIIAGYGKI